MNSAIDIKILLLIGFPIQKSPDLNLFSGSPKLIAANHAFHRLLAPRHPPCALSSLSIILRDYNSHTKEIMSKITFVIVFPHIKLSKSK